MTQYQLFAEPDTKKEKSKKFSLGKGYELEIDPSKRNYHFLYRDNVIKIIKRSDKIAIKIFVVEAVALGVMQTRLSDALEISRQTIHNYREIHRHFGMEGLLHGYTVADSKSRETQREIHAEERTSGNKAQQVAALRLSTRLEIEQEEARQNSLNFSFEENEKSQEIPAEEQPFAEEHEWEETRYAGCFIYWIPLINQWNWLHLTLGHYGVAWPIFAVFLLMSGLNIRSIEQLKHIRQREAGRILGLKKLPGKTQVWSWFYEAVQQKKSKQLLKDYFQYQLRCGLVSFRLWFTDGHLLPYTGKEKLHYSYNTQRQIPVPGRTNQVTCDASGRIVNFIIEEGKGAMKQQIIDVVQHYSSELPSKPMMVFDREGYDKSFFFELVNISQPFVSWEKNIDKAELLAIEAEQFTRHFEFNEKKYSVFEQEKHFEYQPDGQEEPQAFTLRRLIIWNHSSNRRTAGLTNASPERFDTEEAVQAILSRWGASENTFKHLQERHPFHYHPGFKLEKSGVQEIINPEIKQKVTLIRKVRNEIDRLLRRLNKLSDSLKKDGTPRKNSQKPPLQESVKQKEAELQTLREEKKSLPEKVDVSTLENYRSFKKIDNEGKNLFDFVTTSVWNARKQMVDWLAESYSNENDLIDLFYAITHCHGWIRSTDKEVRVRLEPLQQPKRHAAQEMLCRKLTSIGAQTPTGKLLIVEVGKCPL